MINVPESIKELLKADICHKNILIHSVNQDFYDITNDNIESESLSFTESFCSKDFKFGLCEASRLSFVGYGIPNIKGKAIDASIRLDVSSLLVPVEHTVEPTNERLIINFNQFESYVPNATIFRLEMPDTGIYVTTFTINYSGAVSDSTIVSLKEIVGNIYVYEFKLKYKASDTISVTAKINRNNTGVISFLSGDSVDYSTSEDVDYPYYSVGLGRFVVDNCKRDSTNLDKRQVEAYSEIATANWSYPESLGVIPYYTWRSAETMKLTGQNLIDLFCPMASYTRHTMTTLPISTGTTYTRIDKNGDTHEITIKTSQINFHSLNVPHIITFKANKSDFVNANKIMREHFNYYGLSVNDLIPETIKLSYSAYRVKNQTTSISTGAMYGTGKVIVIPIDTEPHTVMGLFEEEFVGSTDTDYTTNYLTVKSADVYGFSLLNKYANIVTEVNDKWYYLNPEGEERWQSFTFNIFDSVEYCTEALDQDGLITMTSKSFRNPNILRVNADGSNTRVKRNDFSFTDDFNKYFNSDMNFKDWIEAYCELMGGFGKFERDGSFVVDYLEADGNLYPSETLICGHNVFPKADGIVLDYTPSEYQRVWYDEEKTKPYSKVCCTYKDSDGDDTYSEYVLVETTDDNAEDYQIYDISSNLYISNYPHTENEIQTILQRIGNKIKSVSYVPFDADVKGLPYVESGDLMRINTAGASFISYMLRRQMKGIQNLTDAITSD